MCSRSSALIINSFGPLGLTLSDYSLRAASHRRSFQVIVEQFKTCSTASDSLWIFLYCILCPGVLVYGHILLERMSYTARQSVRCCRGLQLHGLLQILLSRTVVGFGSLAGCKTVRDGHAISNGLIIVSRKCKL